MAQAEIEKVLDISKEKLYQVITDHPKYVDFVDGMKKVSSTKNTDGTVTCTYDMNTMGKDIKYTILLKEDAAAGMVEWSLVESNFFKKNNGGWKLEAQGPSKVKVKYWLDVEFGISVPSFILSGLVKKSLPGMVESFYQRAKKV